MHERRTASRLSWSLALGRVTLTYDGRPVQQAQVQFTGDRLVQAAQMMQHFGFASRPPVGSKVVGVFLEGDPVNAIAIASNHPPSRPTTLKEGDAALYDSRGQFVLLSANGCTISAGGCTITMAGGVITLKGDAIVTDGMTRLNKGTKAVAVRGSATTRGDTIADGEDDVYA